MIKTFKDAGIRVSIFVDPTIKMIEGAAATGTDRVELYTEGYAKEFLINPEFLLIILLLSLKLVLSLLLFSLLFF